MKIYKRIALTVHAINNCYVAITYKPEVLEMHENIIAKVMKEFPSGSGFDAGTKFSDDSKPERLIFDTAFHHMNDDGYYDGWTYHQVIVTPSLTFDFNLRITGKDRNQIKDYIADCFHDILNRDYIE